MKKLTLQVLRNFNEWFDYSLTEEQLQEIYKELKSSGWLVSEENILDEFERMVSVC